jgi:hypothetical protein
MGKLKLTVNEEKTRICRIPEGEFDFLGYTFGRMYSPKTGQARLGQRPSKKSIQRAVEKIHALTDRAGTQQETTELVGKGAVAGVVGNLGGVVSGLLNEPRPALARRWRPRHGQG